VRDGIELARRERAVVALVTETFWQQGDLIALSNGMPDVPRLCLPHPVAGSGTEAMARLADALAPKIIAVLRGETAPDNERVEANSA
jgi:hypothetical protein